MRVIIAGTRSATYEHTGVAIEASPFNITTVVCGMANGADMSGWRWAKMNDIPIAEYPVDWKKHGAAAGPIRNREMAGNADALILVWDGKSSGSADMLKEAKARGLETFVYTYGGETQ